MFQIGQQCPQFIQKWKTSDRYGKLFAHLKVDKSEWVSDCCLMPNKKLFTYNHGENMLHSMR
jgi:hypothetical protein